MLFAKNRGILGQLVTSPMINFTRATRTLKEHNTQQSHLMAMEDSASFTGIMEGRQLSVQQQLQDHGSRQIQKNREISKAILKVIIFCGKQNISLEGTGKACLLMQEILEISYPCFIFEWMQVM